LPASDDELLLDPQENEVVDGVLTHDELNAQSLARSDPLQKESVVDQPSDQPGSVEAEGKRQKRKREKTVESSQAEVVGQDTDENRQPKKKSRRRRAPESRCRGMSDAEDARESFLSM
jgi:hypothetical protein